MAIGFSNIPADIRVPLFYAEMDNSAANSASSSMRRLIVAQVNDNATSTAVAANLEPTGARSDAAPPVRRR